jgi:transcriptional regulator with AAA-type ATPase domain
VELYAKLSLEKIILKPLRERRQDIKTHLLPYFIDKACRKLGIPSVEYDAAVESWFTGQEWKGNLGELERVVEKVMNHWSKGMLTTDQLSQAGLL